MTTTPYPISGKVYDLDGSTALESAVVTLYNVTKAKWLPSDRASTTNSAGEYTIDPANVPGGYADDDAIQIVTWNSQRTYSMNCRHTIDTATGYLEKDLYLHIGGPMNGPVKVCGVTVTNSTGAGLYVHLYDRKNDHRILPIECPAGDTKHLHFGYGRSGYFFEGGICPVYESETSGEVEVMLNIDDAEVSA